MSKLIVMHSSAFAMIMIGLAVVGSYSVLVFLNYTYNPTFNDARDPGLNLETYFGCKGSNCQIYNWTIDPAADGDAIWPVIKLSTILYSKGIIPLWNPYLASGTPLAADTINFPFSPLIVLYFLPNAFWNLSLLILLWLSGIFTYFFLKCYKLNFVSCMVGSFFFMFSGSMTWFLTHNSVPVILFTPLILLSIEKLFHQNNFKYAVLGSVALAASILGAHLESIILLMVFSISFFIFKVLQTSFSKSENNFGLTNNHSKSFFIFPNRKVIVGFFIIFLGGLGLSSFLIFPVFEYLENSGNIDHPTTSGLVIQPNVASVTPFVPYFLGSIWHTIDPSMSQLPVWNYMGGYVGASCLFFSLLGIIFTKSTNSNIQRIIPKFFFGIGVFFLLKSFGVPIINWIGYSPVLNYIIFPRYDGFIWGLGLAVSAAFGIENLIGRKIKSKDLFIVAGISSAIIIILSLFVIPYFTWDLAGKYMIFQVLQGIFFIIAMLILSIRLQKMGCSPTWIIFPILLELSLYIPLGLNTSWQSYRSLVVIFGIISTLVVTFLPTLRKLDNVTNLKVIFRIIIVITVLTLIGQLIVYSVSPMGLPLRRDAYEPTPLSKFLKERIEYYRIILFNHDFNANQQAAYEIQTPAIIAAFNIQTYNEFFHKLLDPGALQKNLDYKPPSWRSPSAPSFDDEYKINKKYYDLLGVKYIIASKSGPPIPTNISANSAIPIGPRSDDVSQSFISKEEKIGSIAIQLFTYYRVNHGDIILTLDSVPYNETFHRVSIMKAENVNNNNYNIFSFKPILGIKNIKFILSLQFPNATSNNDVAVGIFNKKTLVISNHDHIINGLDGILYIKGSPDNDNMALSVLSNDNFQQVFTDGTVHVYENKDAFPKAFLVNKFRIVDSNIPDFLLKNPSFNLRNEVILEKNLPLKEIQLLNSSYQDQNASTQISSYSANKVVINTNSSSNSLLILTDSYYPDWKAFVDGNETPIYLTDGTVRAIFVPAGYHIVQFSYLPQSFVVGVVISLITISSIVGIFLYFRSKDTQKTINF